jgi:hypothetical protein
MAQGPPRKVPNAHLATSDGAATHRPLSCPPDRCRPWSHAAHGFTALPRAPPTASSCPVTLIPSLLWPIDEVKSLSYSFPCSLALTNSSGPLAVAAVDEPPRQASPELPHRLLHRRPTRCPSVELSTAKQCPAVSRCYCRPPLRAPHLK